MNRREAIGTGLLAALATVLPWRGRREAAPEPPKPSPKWARYSFGVDTATGSSATMTVAMFVDDGGGLRNVRGPWTFTTPEMDPARAIEKHLRGEA